MRKVPHLGRDHFGHICHNKSDNNFEWSRQGRKLGSHRQKIQIHHNHRNTFFCGGSSRVQQAWSSEGLNFISELGQRLTDMTLEKFETSYLFQRLSVAVQRGNTICFSSTIAS